MYLRKFKIFYEEALRDLDIEAYNKAISTLWFSIEALLRGLLLKVNKTPPERAGKLINVAIEVLFRDIEDIFHLSRILNSLYYRRKEIDHRKKIADKADAEKALQKYMKATSIISKKYSWIKQYLKVNNSQNPDD